MRAESPRNHQQNTGFTTQLNTASGMPRRISRSLRKRPGPLRSYEPGMKYAEMSRKRPMK